MSRGRRMACVFFPHLAIERWARARARGAAREEPRDPLGEDAARPGEASGEAPWALAREGPHGPVLHALDAAARARGLREGGRVVDARAIHPDLRVAPADARGDAEALARMALWARRWCPWTAPDGADAIALDVTGAAHLLGGEASLLADVEERLAGLGHGVRTALAPTRGAAWALARHGEARAICGPGDLDARLAPLPVRALRLDEEIDRLLDRLGLRTVGALAALPRAALMRRFAALEADRNPLVLLDRATGRLAEPLGAPPDPERFEARARLAEPVLDVSPHLPDLAERLCADLARVGRGARLLRLVIYRVDGEWRGAAAATARATRDPSHVLRLLGAKLDRLDPGLGLDLATLGAPLTEPLALRQEGLEGGRDPEADLAGLLDRLAARLGAGRVAWPARRESHLPERVEAWRPALGGAAGPPPASGPGSAIGPPPALGPPPAPGLAIGRERPIRLLDPAEEVRVLYVVPEGPPERFVWRRAAHRTLRYEGPERIAPEWWRARPGTRLRDYYKVEVEDGRRFWLYREGVEGDRRGDEPLWFLHGFFA